jgi:Asp-tRNA(Asn)/Glu-tRNA(Gln) amidotransferase A subunit family amidase
MQISGAAGAEDKVIAVASQFERLTEWHRRLPPILESRSVAKS